MECLFNFCHLTTCWLQFQCRIPRLLLPPCRQLILLRFQDPYRRRMTYLGHRIHWSWLPKKSEGFRQRFSTIFLLLFKHDRGHCAILQVQFGFRPGHILPVVLMASIEGLLVHDPIALMNPSASQSKGS